jgi:hypothetical protein
MGAIQSQQKENQNLENKDERKKGVFFKEIQKIEHLLNSIISKNNTFRDNGYNFLNEKVCNKYTMVLESNLKKHLKVHLNDLATNVYLIPKINSVTTKKEVITKDEICTLISTHYNRTLKMLSLVREIYDFENGGDYSIGGIVFRNMKETDGTFEIAYCASSQEPLVMDGSNSRIDFKNLKGLNSFVNDFLNEDEASTFVSHLRELMGKTGIKKLETIMKNDTLIPMEVFSKIYDIYGSKKSLFLTGGGDKRKKQNLMIRVDKNKPILSYELCFDKQKINKPHTRKSRELFNKFKKDYVSNLDEVYQSIMELVYYDKFGETFRLQDLTHDKIINIEKKLKRLVAIFYIQSLVNYLKILNYVKKQE